MMMSNLNDLEQEFLTTLISDNSVYPWNPTEEQSEEFLSKQDESWDFTEELTDSDIENRSANLFASFHSFSS